MAKAIIKVDVRNRAALVQVLKEQQEERQVYGESSFSFCVDNNQRHIGYVTLEWSSISSIKTFINSLNFQRMIADWPIEELLETLELRDIKNDILVESSLNIPVLPCSMQNGLKLQFLSQSDGTGELRAQARNNGFCGSGSAWFSERQLIDFAQNLIQTYPLQTDMPIVLEGGFYNQSDTNLTFAQLHLALSFYPVGSRGQIGCCITLNTPLYEFERPQNKSTFTTELLTSYEQLGEFARMLQEVIKGDTHEATLKAAI